MHPIIKKIILLREILLYPNLQEPIVRNLLRGKIKLEDQKVFLCDTFLPMEYDGHSQPSNDHRLLQDGKKKE